MTSVLRQAISNVRNLFFPARDNEDSRRAGGSSNRTSSFPTLKHFSGIKRHYDHFEAELTEDDDDYPPLVGSKRLKTDQDISIVYYRKKSSPQSNPFLKRPASGAMDSGRHYLETEDDGKVSTYRTSSTATQAEASKGSTQAFSLGAQNTFKFDNEAKKSGDLRVLGSESKMSRFTSCFPGVVHRKEDMFKKSRPDKKSSKAKISNWFNNFGLKNELANTVRLDEKLRYKQLIDKMTNRSQGRGILDQVNIQRLGQRIPFVGTPLHLSRTDGPEVAAIYKNWTFDSSPSVVFRSSKLLPKAFTADKEDVPPSTSATPSMSAGIRLYSLPELPATATRKSLSSPAVPSSSAKFVDLSKEDLENVAPSLQRSSAVKNAESVGIPGFSSTPAARRKLVLPSFGDLNEAEAASDLLFVESDAEEEDVQEIVDNSSKSDDKQLSPRVDDDLLILSESIVRKGRERRVNSLALEQTSSPYSQKSWLQDLSKDFKDSQKQRKQQIEIEKETMQIIQNESKIEQTLHEAIRKKLVLTEIIELEEPPLTLPQITEEMKSVIQSAVRHGRDSDILGTVFNVDITRGDIKTLAPCKWLNDNVINVYMELIADRSKNGKYPKCHIFTTFFYPKYLKEGYSNALKRWTRKVDIFAHDLLIFPIHLGMHWCLAVADLRNKTLKYYDSLGGRNDKCLRALMEYMSHEMKERKSQVLETTEWSLENVKGIPEQENGSDCGMFTCKFAECLSREAKLDFIKQQNMNYYRERMIYELLKKDLMYP